MQTSLTAQQLQTAHGQRANEILPETPGHCLYELCVLGKGTDH